MKKIFSFVMAVCASAMLFAADVTMYSIDFTQGQGEWTIDNKELGSATYVWRQDAKFGMKASAYINQTNVATEAWLISPAIDLTSATTATLKVNHAMNFLNGKPNTVSIKISADNGANWADLSIAMPAGTSWTYQEDEVAINDYAGKTVKIAFAYTSTAEVAPTYEVDKVTILGDGTEKPDEPVVEAEKISMADAIALCEGMADGAYSDKVYRVEGVVSKAYDYDASHNNQTFYFGADADAQKGATLEVYRGVPAEAVAKGDKVAVTGKLGVRTTSKGNRSIGFAEGATVEKLSATAIDNTTLQGKAVKRIIDGQVVIERNGVKYNALGALLAE